jgi:multiple sugar transport system substrate-binding protein
MKIKKMFVITMILMFTFTMSACNEPKKVPAPAPVEIHFQTTSFKTTDPSPYQDAIENFHKLNPQITVTLDYLPTSTAAGTTPALALLKPLESNEPLDIIWLPANVSQEASNKRLLLDLLQLQQMSGSNEIDINKRILDAEMVNGQLLVLPIQAYPQVVYYNKAFFDDAKIPYPQADWTWEQFGDISKKLKPTNGSILFYHPVTFDLLMSSTGKSMLSPDGKTFVGYLDSPEAIRTLRWLNAYYIDDIEQTAPAGFDGLLQFSGLQTGMVIGNIDFIRYINLGDELGVAPLPHFEGGVRANPTSFSGFGISQKSKHPQEAWKFLEYLTLTKNEDSIKYADSFLTTSKTMSEATRQSSDPTKSIFIDEMNNHFVKASMDSNAFSYSAVTNEEVSAQFQELLTTADEDIPAKLHDLALNLDQEMNRLKIEDDQQQENVSP